MFKTILQNTSAEITEKKSRFICNLIYVENQEDAEKIIKEMKKKYHDARHNCIAYRIIENGTIIEKCNDDGEPTGTAGKPILDVIKKQQLNNVLIVVVRYFGKIKLGAGGLVRAYSNSASEVLKKAEKYTYKKTTKINFSVSIDNYYKFVDILNSDKITEKQTNFGDGYCDIILFTEDKYSQNIINEIKSLTDAEIKTQNDFC